MDERQDGVDSARHFVRKERKFEKRERKKKEQQHTLTLYVCVCFFENERMHASRERRRDDEIER